MLVKARLEGPYGTATLDRSAPIDPVPRQTDRQAPEHAQNQRGVAMAHPTAVFIQTHIQRLVQPALNHPIEPLVLE